MTRSTSVVAYEAESQRRAAPNDGEAVRRRHRTQPCGQRVPLERRPTCAHGWWLGAVPARVAGMHRMRPLGSRTRTRDNGRDQSRPVLCCRVSRGGQRNPGGASGQRRFNAAPVRAKRPIPFPPSSDWLGWRADKRETLASPVLLRQALLCATGRNTSVSKSSGRFNLNLLYYYRLGSTSANILITCPEAGNHGSLYLRPTYRKFNPDGAKKGDRRGIVQLFVCAPIFLV
jgi:hypothetical protein